MADGHPLLAHLEDELKKRLFDLLQLREWICAHGLLLETGDAQGDHWPSTPPGEKRMADAKAKACGSTAQSDALVLLHALRLHKDAATMLEGVSVAHMAGKAANLDYSQHGRIGREERERFGARIPT